MKVSLPLVFFIILTKNYLILHLKNREDIVKLISGLDPNTAHGHDEISISMLKICD